MGPCGPIRPASPCGPLFSMHSSDGVAAHTHGSPIRSAHTSVMQTRLRCEIVICFSDYLMQLNQSFYLPQLASIRKQSYLKCLIKRVRYGRLVQTNNYTRC